MTARVTGKRLVMFTYNLEVRVREAGNEAYRILYNSGIERFIFHSLFF